ncbi:MAG: cell wall protein [Hamadaea sp.]|uniref:cell wall protein n=1 Tax=Hamadaea sp. TaxID=2024425 RepID=UPI0017D7AC15|nr:cell wall protein [Hamadaea sp.]NUR73035.1 cell wall protein [Hamadaea sp.]NUT22987.1 cell wall protein [Hamadaea sp.]
MALNMDRRSLLTSAVLGSATLVGATALGSLAPEAAFAKSDDVEPGAPDPNFAEGRVTGINEGMLLVAGSDGTLWRIRVTNASSIWKLHPTSLDKVAVGDGLYARGVRLGDGTLAADAIWVNIVNLQVHIAALAPKKIHFDHRGKRIIGHVVPGVTAASYNSTPAIADMTMVQVGRHAQVIGAWLPDTNEIEIATLYTSTIEHNH